MRLELSPSERDELVRLIETSIAETRVELRRTRNPQWHDELDGEECLLKSLLDRLRELES